MKGLTEMIITTEDSLGYPSRWGRELSERLAQAMPEGVEPYRLDSLLLDDIARCEGLWLGKTTVEQPPKGVIRIRGEFLHAVTMRYLEASIHGEGSRPLDFVVNYLATEENLDPLTSAWIHLLPLDERQELTREIATSISLLLSQCPSITDGDLVSFGPVIDELSTGGVTLGADVVDLTFGDHRLGVDVNWPGAVLVRLKPGGLLHTDIDLMKIDALVHTMATGCPPQRLVTYGLTSGQTFGFDVERGWLEYSTGLVLSAVRSMQHSMQTQRITVTPGEHCVLCPFQNDCEASEADLYPF